MITSDQQQAVQDYINNSTPTSFGINDSFAVDITESTFQLNQLLRARIIPTNASQFIFDLDNAIVSQPIEEELLVYRGYNYKAMLRWIQGDKWYVDPGYLSTTKRLSTATRFVRSPEVGYSPAMMVITLKPGSSVLDVHSTGMFSDNEEDEVLIKRSAKFSIERIYCCKYSELSKLTQEPVMLAINPYEHDYDVHVLYLTLDSYLPS